MPTWQVGEERWPHRGVFPTYQVGEVFNPAWRSQGGRRMELEGVIFSFFCLAIRSFGEKLDFVQVFFFLFICLVQQNEFLFMTTFFYQKNFVERSF